MAMALLEAKARNVERAEQFWNEALKKPGPSAGQFAVNYGLYAAGPSTRPPARPSAFQRVLDEKLLPGSGRRTQFLHRRAPGRWPRNSTRRSSAAREAAKLEPNSARMVAREPWVLYQAKRLDEAEQAYRAILDRFDADHASEDNREALRDIRFVLSAINVEQDRLADAEEWLQQVLDEFPEDIGAFNDLGYLWCDQGKHLQRSLAMLQKAVQAEPDNVAYRDSLGWALYRVGRYTEALAELQKAAGGRPGRRSDPGSRGRCLLEGESAARRPSRRGRKPPPPSNGNRIPKRLGQVQDKIKQHAPQ